MYLMYDVVRKKRFEKDAKKLHKRNKNIDKLIDVVALLAKGEPFTSKKSKS